MMEITRTKNKEEAIKKASSRLNQILDAHSHVPTLFLSSGGSSSGLLERIVIFPPNFIVGMTDERFSEDPKVNNFAQLAETGFFEKAQDRGAYFIDTRVQRGEDLEVFAKRFEAALTNWKEEHPGGRIVITQGVGADGHTAGIMPYPKEKSRFQELFEGDALVRGYDAQKKNEYPLRATITLPFLRMVDHSVLYMVGKEKKEALKRALKVEGTLWETPARIIHEMKEVHIFTDIQIS
ncbi:6-phosphogluconolactonase [Patescibacteria group bacterium]|nr:6-phosphogluconolactonase [Patescibacteria group bacterium]